MLLAAAVRHRAPDGKVCCSGPLRLITVFSLFFQTRFIFYVPRGSTVASISLSNTLLHTSRG